MSTARDLITDAMRVIGVVASGETLGASDLETGIRSMNRMLDAWSADGLNIPSFRCEVFLLIPGKAEYTVGPLADFNTERPTRVIRASLTDPEITQVMIDPGSPGDPGDPLAIPPIPPTDPVDPTYETVVKATYERPLKVLTFDEWASIRDKRYSSTDPDKVYVENTSPLNTLLIHPVPSVQKGIVLYTDKVLSKIEDAAEEISFPPGYEDAIVYNLAKRLSTEFGKAPSPEIFSTAGDLLMTIKRFNYRPLVMRSDAPLGCGYRYNVYTDEL